jgi:hypothetical protein
MKAYVPQVGDLVEFYDNSFVDKYPIGIVIDVTDRAPVSVENFFFQIMWVANTEILNRRQYEISSWHWPLAMGVLKLITPAAS